MGRSVKVLAERLGKLEVLLSARGEMKVEAIAARMGVSVSTVRRDLDGLVADAGAPGRDPEYGFGVLDLQLLK